MGVLPGTLHSFPAEALGGLRRGVSPLEMANVYSTIADGGWRNKQITIRKVVFPGGRVDSSWGVPHRTKVLSTAATTDETEILQHNVQYGTATGSAIGCPTAAKTGTTSGLVDAWLDGFTPNRATVVWMGYPKVEHLDDRRPRPGAVRRPAPGATSGTTSCRRSSPRRARRCRTHGRPDDLRALHREIRGVGPPSYVPKSTGPSGPTGASGTGGARRPGAPSAPSRGDDHARDGDHRPDDTRRRRPPRPRDPHADTNSPRAPGAGGAAAPDNDDRMTLLLR